MIAGSDYPLTIGQQGKGIVDKKLDYHKQQPFVVLREATLEEWIQAQIANGYTREQLLRNPNVSLSYFYEVSVD